VGAAAPVSVLRGLRPRDDPQPLAIAMCSGRADGGDRLLAHPYNQGLRPVPASSPASIAGARIETAPTAFEGEKGMLSSFSARARPHRTAPRRALAAAAG